MDDGAYEQADWRYGARTYEGRAMHERGVPGGQPYPYRKQPGFGYGQQPYGSGYQASGYQGSSLTERETGSGPHVGKGPKGYRRSDDRIKEDCCEQMRDHDGLDASEVDVTVQGGEVTLAGEVSDRRSKRMAEDCCEGIAGVTDVHNQLRVKPQQSSSTQSESRTDGRSGNGGQSSIGDKRSGSAADRAASAAGGRS